MLNNKRVGMNLLLLFLLFITACTSYIKGASKDYISQTPLIYEPSDQLDNLDANMIGQTAATLLFTEYDCLPQKSGQYAKFRQTTFENVGYYVDKDEYSEEECIEIVYYVNKIIKRLKDENGFSEPENLCIYISNKVITQGIYANIYINSIDIKSINGLIAMMAGFYGEFSNYGLCYGLALHMNSEKRSGVDLAEYFSIEENIVLLDFSIAVFEMEYFDENDNLHADLAAYYFTKYIIEQYGIEMLTSLIDKSAELSINFDILYTEKCNEWLLSIDAKCIRKIPQIAIKCVKNYGRTWSMYKYIFHTRDMQSYIPIGFTEEEIGIELTYTEIIKMLTYGEQDINIIKEYLSPYFIIDLKQVNCYYIDEGNTNQHLNGYIEYMFPYSSFTHEYVHYITSDYKKNPVWLSEGIAVYMSAYFQNKLFNQSTRTGIEQLLITKIEDKADNNTRVVMAVFSDLLSNEPETSLSALYCDLGAFISYSGIAKYYNFSELHMSGKSEGWFMTYLESGSLINYLITTYGADTFFSLFKGETTLDEAYGKNINELYEEWGNYIVNEYKNILYDYDLKQ